MKYIVQEKYQLLSIRQQNSVYYNRTEDKLLSSMHFLHWKSMGKQHLLLKCHFRIAHTFVQMAYASSIITIHIDEYRTITGIK